MQKNIIKIILILFSVLMKSQEASPNFLGVDTNFNTLKNDSVNGRSQNIGMFVNIPVIKNNKNFIGTKLRYHYYKISDVNAYFNHQLTTTEVNIYWQRTFNNGSKLNVFGQTGIYSDFKDIAGNDFRYRLGVIYNSKNSAKLSSGLGLVYSRQFFGHQINPVVVVNYDLNSKLNISGLLPVRPKLTYKINDKLLWINEFSGNVESYRLSETEFSNSFIEISGWYAMSTLELKLKKYHHLNFGIGYTFKNKLRFYNDTQEAKWKIFTFDLHEKSEPVSEIKLSGLRWLVGYSFGL